VNASTPNEPPLAHNRVVTRPPSEAAVRYAGWLTANTGVQVDVRSVGLAIALLGPYKASPEHLEAMAQKEERLAADRAEIARRKRERASAATARQTAARTPRHSAAFNG
jgi:hypothetical protein